MGVFPAPRRNKIKILRRYRVSETPIEKKKNDNTFFFSLLLVCVHKLGKIPSPKNPPKHPIQNGDLSGSPFSVLGILRIENRVVLKKDRGGCWCWSLGIKRPVVFFQQKKGQGWKNSESTWNLWSNQNPKIELGKKVQSPKNNPTNPGFWFGYRPEICWLHTGSCQNRSYFSAFKRTGDGRAKRKAYHVQG